MERLKRPDNSKLSNCDARFSAWMHYADQLEEDKKALETAKRQLQINLKWLYDHKDCPVMTIEQGELIKALIH